MLETLFELRWRIRELHFELIGNDGGEETEEDDA
jgi:hypothetical protein